MKQTLVQQFSETQQTTCSLVPDYIMLTDTISDAMLEKLENLDIPSKNKLIVCIDHDTPNSSIAVGKKQRRLLTWALDRNLTVEKCQGVGYIRLLESYVKHNDIIAGTGYHMAGLGAAGALGIRMTEDELWETIKNDKVTLPHPAVLTISLTGTMPNYVSIQDVALAIQKEYSNKIDDHTLIVFKDETGLTTDQRYDLCHFAQQYGACSALFTEETISCNTRFDISATQPLVVLPGTSNQTEYLGALHDIHVNEVFIGGCRGGKLEDLRAAAAILKGKHIAYRLRLVVTPATSSIYLQALREGLIDIFLDCGAVVMNQGCSVCWGKAQGILDAGEVLVSTGSYHYPGCCSDTNADVYLVSPCTAAHCAITGTLSE